MVPWIETKQFTLDLFPNWTKTEGDKEWSLGAVTVDVSDITARLDKLIASLNEDQWEIKMVVPLDKSLTYHEHQKVVRQGNRREAEAVLGAFGLGWAAGTTSSLLWSASAPNGWRPRLSRPDRCPQRPHRRCPPRGRSRPRRSSTTMPSTPRSPPRRPFSTISGPMA